MFRGKVKANLVILFALSAFFISEASTNEFKHRLSSHDRFEARFRDLTHNAKSNTTLNYRLPNTTEPVHYDINITTDVHNGTKKFKGNVNILITVKDDTKTIVLHKRQIKILEVTIREANKTNAKKEVLIFSYEKTREFLILTPEKKSSLSFKKSTTWILTIAYEGELRIDNGGFYLSTYTDAAGNKRFLAATQFETTDARHAFPCFDEPSKRATFSIFIKHSASYHALSNMPLSKKDSSPGYSVFEKTVNIPTYVVAFIVSDFKYTEGVLKALPQRIYSRPATVHKQEFALVSGLLILKRLVDYYGVDIPLPKMYLVALPDFAAGAMENWGLPTFREEYLLYNKDESSASTQTYISVKIAHEYCHHWFGNLVVFKWWTYVWLKEGFATLFSFQATNEVYPEWDVFQVFHTDEYQVALTDEGNGDRDPMTHYVQMPDEISTRYDSVTYSKAGSVLRMWQKALSDTIFRKGVNIYLTENKYNNADEDQLFSALSKAVRAYNVTLPASIKEMLSSWSQQSGYPLLTVHRDYNKKSFTIKQEAYYDNKNLTSNNTWYIPLNYAYKSNPDHRNTTASHYMLKSKEIVINDDNLSADDWLILNKQSTSFYRINYDEQNWNLIIDALKSRPYKFHPHNRAQFINDAYTFSMTGRLNQTILLSMFQYLQNEDQFVAWFSADAIITKVDRYLGGDADHKFFQTFVALLVEDFFDKLGVNDIPGEHHLTKFNRNIAINLACLAGIKSCLEETNQKLKAFINNGVAIEPNLRFQTFCNGLRQSGDTEFDFVYNYLLQNSDEAFRNILISSLGCSENESHLQKLINSSLDESAGWRTQERTTLLYAAYSRSSTGFLACINFLDDNWEKYSNLATTFEGDPLNIAMIDLAGYVVNHDQESKYLALLDKVKESNKVQKDLQKVAKTKIQENNDWLRNNRDTIMSWVKKNVNENSAALQ